MTVAIFAPKGCARLLEQYDVPAPAKLNYYIEAMRRQYGHAYHKRDLDETERIVCELCPSAARRLPL